MNSRKLATPNSWSTGKDYGEVRQTGKFSFTRIWESGHEISYFQPEAAFAVYIRSAHGVDIATGMVDTRGNSTYGTKGPEKTTYRREISKEEWPKCPEGGYADW